MNDCTHLLQQRMKSSDENAFQLFSQSMMVTVGMSKLCCIGLMFIDTGVRVDEVYYYDFLLSQQLLPAIRQMSGVFIRQHDSAPTYRQWRR